MAEGRKQKVKKIQNNVHVVVRICFQLHLCSGTKINSFLSTANVTNNITTHLSMIKRGTYVAVTEFSTPFHPEPRQTSSTIYLHSAAKDIKISAMIQKKLSKGFLSSKRIMDLPTTGATTDFSDSFIIIITII
jgi:hypothetical protein